MKKQYVWLVESSCDYEGCDIVAVCGSLKTARKQLQQYIGGNPLYKATNQKDSYRFAGNTVSITKTEVLP